LLLVLLSNVISLFSLYLLIVSFALKLMMCSLYCQLTSKYASKLKNLYLWFLAFMCNCISIATPTFLLLYWFIHLSSSIAGWCRPQPVPSVTLPPLSLCNLSHSSSFAAFLLLPLHPTVFITSSFLNQLSFLPLLV